MITSLQILYSLNHQDFPYSITSQQYNLPSSYAILLIYFLCFSSTSRWWYQSGYHAVLFCGNVLCTTSHCCTFKKQWQLPRQEYSQCWKLLTTHRSRTSCEEKKTLCLSVCLCLSACFSICLCVCWYMCLYLCPCLSFHLPLLVWLLEFLLCVSDSLCCTSLHTLYLTVSPHSLGTRLVYTYMTAYRRQSMLLFWECYTNTLLTEQEHL